MIWIKQKQEKSASGHIKERWVIFLRAILNVKFLIFIDKQCHLAVEFYVKPINISWLKTLDCFIVILISFCHLISPSQAVSPEKKDNLKRLEYSFTFQFTGNYSGSSHEGRPSQEGVYTILVLAGMIVNLHEQHIVAETNIQNSKKINKLSFQQFHVCSIRWLRNCLSAGLQYRIERILFFFQVFKFCILHANQNLFPIWPNREYIFDWSVNYFIADSGACEWDRKILNLRFHWLGHSGCKGDTRAGLPCNIISSNIMLADSSYMLITNRKYTGHNNQKKRFKLILEKLKISGFDNEYLSDAMH